MKSKHVALIVGIIVVAFIFVAVAIYLEDPFLDSQVTTGANLLMDEWRQTFRFWAIFGIIIAALSALVWFAFAQWAVNLNYWTNANKKRVIWLLFILLPCGASVTAWLLTPPVQEGAMFVTAFYVLNNLAVFYFSTVLFSPSSFKYTPAGAMRLRPWW